MSFSEEYQDLENRVVEAFTDKRKEFESITFLDRANYESDYAMYEDLETCPTSYYNHKHSGEERHIYIIKIDEEGIHAVNSDDYTEQVCIGINDLNGLYYKIDLLEEINKVLNKQIN